MGLSSSNSRRRTTTFYHHPPPPPPPPPPYYYHPTDPAALPPPTPLQNYYTVSTSPPSQSYPPSHCPYPTHSPSPQPQPPPAPPPPPIHAYYNYHPYHPCNFANHSHQPFYYTSHYQATSGWPPAIRPDMGLTPAAAAQPIQQAPFVDHQNAKRVRNDVNVHKDTLKVEIDEQNRDHHLVSFVFDSLFDGSITIFYIAKEEQDGRFVPVFPEVHLPVKIPFRKGLGQRFRQPSGTGIDLGFFELDDLSKTSPEEDVFPLLIAAETCVPDDLMDEDDDSVSQTPHHMQVTQAILEKKNGEDFQVRVISQILWVAGVRYELREIYGIGSSEAEGFNDSEPGKECVICMSEPKDTAVLPCRHMCMCSECARELRLQSNKCPICRQPIEQLIRIRINSDSYCTMLTCYAVSFLYECAF